MSDQNYKNHIHWVPLYHFLTIPAMVIAIFCCGILGYLYPENIAIFSTLILLVLLIGSVAFHCRSFALKVQDRTIVLEENFRHYRLTGKTLDPRLTVDQIIALRFASDSEFLELCQKAIDENLTNREIKKMIKHWKSDLLRA